MLGISNSTATVWTQQANASNANYGADGVRLRTSRRRRTGRLQPRPPGWLPAVAAEAILTVQR